MKNKCPNGWTKSGWQRAIKNGKQIKGAKRLEEITLDELFTATPLYQWGWRQAWCIGKRTYFPEESIKEKYYELQDKYVKEVQALGSYAMEQNYTTFKVILKKQIRYVMFTDGNLVVSNKIVGAKKNPVPPEIKYKRYRETYDGSIFWDLWLAEDASLEEIFKIGNSVYGPKEIRLDNKIIFQYGETLASMKERLGED